MTADTDILYFDHMPSPAGPLLLVADALGLRRIGFERDRYPTPVQPHWQHAPDRLRFARDPLQAYFDGDRQPFELPLRPLGTPFQRRVWAALADIPYGQTRSYAQLAQAIGQPSAVRAVGAANGRNPLPIVLPCHRVIGADGSLTGFGGGLDVKHRLLLLEGAIDPAATVDLFGATRTGAASGSTRLRHDATGQGR